jgi:putative SOS response-associated peptidase YedK
MCGRKTLTKGKMEIIEELSIQIWDDSFELQPNYNVAPGQTMPILIYNGRRIVKPMRWGLIPRWAQDSLNPPQFINARSETLTAKRSFSDLIGVNRCIVITDGYYEWRKTASGKRPYYITKPDRNILPMAGLWSQWADSQGVTVFTYTVITTAANHDLEFIHPRMPAILTPEELDPWLNCAGVTPDAALPLLHPLHEKLDACPVSPFVNNVRNNSPRCIERDNSAPGTLFP